ncbi:MAG: hypothetical protein SCALA702_17400 [Melioribacteraceae bacterium]|nr:MAG: hypothetical protein SCALA702_17400 [Melioribacteraceae bacterium]
MCKRIITIISLLIILVIQVTAQIDSLFLLPEGNEQFLQLPETTSGPQLNNSIATDGETNFAYSCYLPEYSKVYFLLKDIDGNIITEKLYAVNSNMTAVPSVKMNDGGNGILLIIETNTYNSKVRVYQFHKSGYIDPIPKEMPFNLNGPGLVGTDISNENLIAFSWLKKTGGTSKDSIFTQFYDFDMLPKSDKILVNGWVLNLNQLEVRHEFREDGTYMVFLLLGEPGSFFTPRRIEKVYYKNFSSVFIPETSFRQYNFHSTTGSDIFPGDTGEFYTVSANQQESGSIESYLTLKRYNVDGTKIGERQLETMMIEDISTKYINETLYIHFSYITDNFPYGNSTVRAFTQELADKFGAYTPISNIRDCKSTLFDANYAGNYYAGVTMGPKFSGVEHQRFEYIQYSGDFQDIVHPHPGITRPRQNIYAATNSVSGLVSAIWTDGLFGEIQPHFIYINDLPPNNHIYNFNFSAIFNYCARLDLSYNDNDRFIGGLYNKGYSTGIFSYDRTADILKYRSIQAGNVFDMELIPSGGNSYTALFVSDRNGWDLSSTISFVKFDAYATPISPIIEVENSLVDSAHFSDHPVWAINHEDSLLMTWSFTDYYHEKQKIMFRWFTKNFELLDSTLYELDYFSQNFIKPLKLYFDNTGKTQLLVKLTDDWISWEGELQKWEIGFNGNGFDLLNISQINGFSNDKITGIKPIDDNNYMFTLTDLDNDEKSLIVYNKSGEIVSERYSISELVEQPVVKNIAYTFFENEMTLYFEGMYEQDGIESQVVYQQKIIIENPTLSVDNNNIIASDFIIHRNYPNPFNPSTNISFLIPEAGNVKIEVFNSLGQLVEVLISGFFTAGEHNIRFNALNFGSGVYYYTVSYNNETKSGKMLLLK